MVAQAMESYTFKQHVCFYWQNYTKIGCGINDPIPMFILKWAISLKRELTSEIAGVLVHHIAGLVLDQNDYEEPFLLHPVLKPLYDDFLKQYVRQGAQWPLLNDIEDVCRRQLGQVNLDLEFAQSLFDIDDDDMMVIDAVPAHGG
jgi:hypothetical protein